MFSFIQAVSTGRFGTVAPGSWGRTRDAETGPIRTGSLASIQTFSSTGSSCFGAGQPLKIMEMSPPR